MDDDDDDDDDCRCMHYVHAVSGQSISPVTLRNAREGNNTSMTSSHALCLVDHDPGRRAAPGLTVCHSCRTHALDATAQMPALWRHLEDYLDNHTGTSNGPIVTTSRDPGLNLNQAVVRTRANIRIHLECWTRIGIDEGPWHTRPTNHLEGMATWIATRIDWYCSQDWSDEFVTQTLELRAEGRRHRQPNKAATFTVGPCPEPDCGGTLITRLRPADSLLPSVIWCDKAPEDPETGEQLHVWPAGDGWHQLGRKIHKRAIQ